MRWLHGIRLNGRESGQALEVGGGQRGGAWRAAVMGSQESDTAATEQQPVIFTHVTLKPHEV